ncbi:MAG: preprotein translocase subunit SecG [Alphaproteobacteria bacterium]|nr:preprotein translocase subunit SecG [Alphaproteobacteria bacterium]
MGSVLLVLQLIVAIFLVAVILMQRSNGGALSGLGGDSGIGGLISARGKGNILTRITAVLATLFFALSMAISIYFSRVEIKSSSIVDGAANSAAPVAEDTLPVREENIPENAEIPAEQPAEPVEPQVPVAE